jgi:hypothetical protein
MLRPWPNSNILPIKEFQTQLVYENGKMRPTETTLRVGKEDEEC